MNKEERLNKIRQKTGLPITNSDWKTEIFRQMDAGLSNNDIVKFCLDVDAYCKGRKKNEYN